MNAYLDDGNTPNAMPRNTLVGIGLLAIVAVAMLLWPILGRPPYAYYLPLKWVVVAASVTSAWAVFVLNRAFLPLAVLLIASGGVELLASMRRADWFMFNVASIVLLVLAAAVLLWTAILSRNSREPKPDSTQENPWPPRNC